MDFFHLLESGLLLNSLGLKMLKFWMVGLNLEKNKYITQKCEKKYKYGRCYNVLCFEETLIHRSEIIKKQSDDLQIIDARPVSRFLEKIQEPRQNLRKGNIKNITNIYFGEIINNCGKLKSNHKLIEIFNIYNKKKETVCYCGSGITACNIIFVLNILNFGKIKLYDGSWAEWGKKINNKTYSLWVRHKKEFRFT